MKIHLVNIFKPGRITWFTVIMTIASCTNPSNQPEAIKETRDTIRSKPPSSFSDTIVVTVASAIFFKPDSLQLEKIKMATDSTVFESMQHDCFYQMRNAGNLLTNQYLKIKIIEVVNASHLLFKMTNGQIKIINLNTNNDPCGIYLFRPDKDPRLTDMTNIDTELGFYFSK